MYSGYSNKNISKATEGMVVKVNDLTVKEKDAASSFLATGGPVQGGHLLGQEDRGQVPSLPVPVGAASGQVDLERGPLERASLGQEGQGLAARRAPNKGALQDGQEGCLPVASQHSMWGDDHGQEDQNASTYTPAPPTSEGQEGQALVGGAAPTKAAVPGQAGQDMLHQGNSTSPIRSIAAMAAYQPNSVGQESRAALQWGDQLLFRPGVLEALSGAVAARLATKNTTDTPIYTFNATKKSMQGKTKEKGRKGKKGGGIGSSEGARKNIIGKKRSLYEAPATGSELDFSFEKTMDSYERILYGDINVSSKRVYMGRVEAVRDGNGVVTHVSKEVEEKEEAPGQ